jgi:predicted TIM-barrel fold metal-dependent hydrolase
VRGVRINLLNTSGLPLDAAAGLARRIAPLGWHLQFQIGPDQIDRVRQIAGDGILPVVVDHLACIPVDAPRAEADLAALQRLLDTGLAYVKISAPYRVGSAPDFARAAARLAASHPERLLWGTDWPHSDLYADMPDDTDLVSEMLATFQTPDLRRLVLVDTPARLYWS